VSTATRHQQAVDRAITAMTADLTGTHLSVADIAARVGYQSVGTFPARFKVHVGCSPTAYRKGER
jgi:AraC-like DNA-binding protein